MAETILELYFHIPFCIKKCFYCDFLSAPGSDTEIAKYVEALCREIQEAPLGGVGDSLKEEQYTVSSIFFGGGTPSLLLGDQVEILLKKARERFCVAQDAEITLEVNPGTVDFEKLLAYKKAGVNRLSIGLQSINENELQAIGRIHTHRQFLETYENARRAGFDNVNVDIISGLPEQSVGSYLGTISRLLLLIPPPEHISAYSLIVEEGTPLFERKEKGELKLPDEDTERLLYKLTGRSLMEHGYHKYEISNYAKPGFECRHNSGYWKRINYLGFGLGAASLMENVRFHNTRDLQEYLENPLNCRQEIYALSKEEQMEEFMFLGLRMTEGVSIVEFERQFDVSIETVYGAVITKNIDDKLLFRKDDFIALTDRGIDVSNYVMAQFLLT